MVRSALTTFSLVAIGLARDPGCGDVEHPNGGPNAPCTRQADCSGDLVCAEGVCTGPDSPKDASDQ